MTSPNLIGKQLRNLGHTVLRLSKGKSADSSGRGTSRSPLLFIGSLCLIPLLGIGAVYYTSPDVPINAATHQTLTTIEVRLPDLRSQMADIESRNEVVNHEVFVSESETLTSLLARLGVRDPEVENFIVHTPDALELVHPKPEQFITASVYEDGTLLNLKAYLDSSSSTQLLEITRSNRGLTFTIKPYKYVVQLVMANGIIHGSSAVSLQQSNIPSKIVSQMHEAFDYDRDVVSQLTNNDAFRIIYEAKYAEGSFVRYGKLLAMQLEHAKKTTELFWFADDDQGGNYYDAKGHNIKRIFMRVPLDVKSVSSEFAALRRHPITGVVRPHNGTDFRAPWGATVRAAADGKVIFAGMGTGYGKYIKIQHGPDCQTRYAHLSVIDPSVVKGRDVKAGQKIGRVGQTGLATGPHLHYELIIDGVQMNPMKAKLPDKPTLSPYKFAQMEVLIAPLREKLSLLKRAQTTQTKKKDKG